MGELREYEGRIAQNDETLFLLSSYSGKSSAVHSDSDSTPN